METASSIFLGGTQGQSSGAGATGSAGTGGAGEAGISSSGATGAQAPTFQSEDGFTPDQVSQMAKWAVEHGLMTQEQADKALSQDGITAAKADTPAGATDPALIGAKPEQYEIPSMLGPDEPYSGEVAKLDKQLRGWLADSGFSREVGSALAQKAGKVISEYKAMSENERALWTQREKIIAQNSLGAKFAERMELARQLVEEIESKSPGIADYLEHSGLGNSSYVIVQLALQAERLLQKRYGKIGS